MPRAREREDSNETCLTGKPGFLPHKPQRLLPGGFWESASVASQSAQSTGARSYPSPFPTSSSALATPLACRILGLCPAQLLCHVALYQALGPQARLGCHGNALPLDCLVSPKATGMSQKSHPSGQHPNCLSQTATLIMSNRKIFSGRVLIFSLENRWPPLQGPHTPFFPFSLAFRPLFLSAPSTVWWLQAQARLLSSDFSSSTSQPFDLGLILGA